MPWEENYEEAHEKKSLKYADLMAECRDRGWNVWLFPVEVGCRGFTAQSVWKLFQRLGMNESKSRKTAERRLSSREGIMLVMEAGIHRVVDWPLLLTHQLEDIMVKGRNIRRI